MKISILNAMYDERLKSLSVMSTMTVRDYLDLVASAYSNQGSIEGQRGEVTSTTAHRIQRRMADDIRNGTILPPLVLGVAVGEETVRTSRALNSYDLARYLEGIDPSNVSIIDGMQRTNVLKDLGESVISKEIRVEFWLVRETSSLTYRMLVLNTGQTPWTLRRQLEVLHASLLKEIETQMERKAVLCAPALRIEIIGVDDKRRRVSGGQFHANEIVEMYIAFGTRKGSIDKGTILADQFTRLDMIDAVSTDVFFPYFIDVFAQFASVDCCLSRLQVPGVEGRFKLGKSIFDSLSASVSFFVAASQLAFGRPGNDRPKELVEKVIQDCVRRCKAVCQRLASMDPAQLADFVDLATLNETIPPPASRIGELERAYFLDAFRYFLSEDDLNAMTPCWRAH